MKLTLYWLYLHASFGVILFHLNIILDYIIVYWLIWCTPRCQSRLWFFFCFIICWTHSKISVRNTFYVKSIVFKFGIVQLQRFQIIVCFCILTVGIPEYYRVLFTVHTVVFGHFFCGLAVLVLPFLTYTCVYRGPHVKLNIVECCGLYRRIF